MNRQAIDQIFEAICTNDHSGGVAGYEHVAVTGQSEAVCENCVQEFQEDFRVRTELGDPEWTIINFVSSADIGGSLTCSKCGSELSPYEDE